MNVDPQDLNEMDAAFDERCRALLEGRSVTPPPPSETLFAPAGRRSAVPLALGVLVLAGAGVGGWLWSGADKAPERAVAPEVETPQDGNSSADAAADWEAPESTESTGAEAVSREPAQSEIIPAAETPSSASEPRLTIVETEEERVLPESSADKDAPQAVLEVDAEPEVSAPSAPQEARGSNAPASSEESEDNAMPAQEEEPTESPEEGPRQLTLPITVPSDGGH